jgi:hypothetical protein
MFVPACEVTEDRGGRGSDLKLSMQQALAACVYIMDVVAGLWARAGGLPPGPAIGFISAVFAPNLYLWLVG